MLHTRRSPRSLAALFTVYIEIKQITSARFVVSIASQLDRGHGGGLPLGIDVCKRPRIFPKLEPGMKSDQRCLVMIPV